MRRREGGDHPSRGGGGGDKRIAPRAWGLAIALAVGAAGGGEATASPEDVFGFGVRSPGMAGTGVAAGEGYETVYTNPSLLSLSTERTLTFGTMGAAFDLRAQSPGRDSAVPYEALAGSLIGAVLPIPLGGVLANRFVVGLGFYAPYDLIVRARLRFSETPQFPLADRTQSVAIQAGLGLSILPSLRVGGGFAALAALKGTVVVQTDTSGRLGTVIDDTLIARYAPILGASYDVNEHYRLGLTYRGELSGPLDVAIQVEDLGQLKLPPLFISGTAQYDPHQIAVEVARVGGPLEVALGVTWKHWSAYPGPVEATVRCEYDAETLEVLPCQALSPPDPGYSDTFVPRVGVERSFAPTSEVTMRLRGGYALEPTPAPEQTGAANVFDEARSLLSLGYGVALRSANPTIPPIQLDVFGQLHLLHGRTHEKDAGIAADNPGAPEIRTSGIVFAGGTQLGVSF